MSIKPISIQNYKIEEPSFALMAGPCSIESFDQFECIVKFLKTQGVQIIRGGVFKLRTNPKDFQGLGEKALPIVKEVKKTHNFLFITEVTDPRQIDSLMDVTDIFQVGTRNMFNYELLKELGKINQPVLLKRHFSAQIREWLLSSEYIAQGGNDKILLCERGIRTFEAAYRNTFDINAAVYLRKTCPYPVIIDPSHATGDSSLVSDISMAALAVKSHGLLVEVHKDPKKALSDKAQALDFKQFSQLIKNLKKLSNPLEKIIV